MGVDKFIQAMCPFHSEENLRYSLTSLDGTEAEDIFYWQGLRKFPAYCWIEHEFVEANYYAAEIITLS